MSTPTMRCLGHLSPKRVEVQDRPLLGLLSKDVPFVVEAGGPCGSDLRLLSACYGDAGCDCAPSLVLPGAVLGPELPPAGAPGPPATTVPAPRVLSSEAGGPIPPPPLAELEELLD